MIPERRDRPDPRSPVQPAPSSAPYVIAAIGLAIVIWATQQIWTQLSNFNSERARPISSSPEHAGDLRTVFSGDDYPRDAQIKGEEGTAQARLSVDAKGKVSACTIIRSSGSQSLDEATCRILKRRARFIPAHDANEEPVPTSVVTPPVTWRLED